MPFFKSPKFADFAVFHETLITHKKRTKGRINILRTVLESSSAIFSEKQVCIMKLHVFHAFLQPKRYDLKDFQIIPFWLQKGMKKHVIS